MDSGHGKVVRMNVEGDRLSILPDDIIHKILCFISIKYAIQTCVLSSRWRFIWKSMVYLNFSSEDFTTLDKFSEFVTHTLSRRDNQIALSSVNLSFPKNFSKLFLKRILNYAFSHNVKQLTFSCLRKKNFDFPLLCSRSLKYLRLIGHTEHRGVYPLTLASTWELPALTTLHLDNISFYDDYNTDKGIGLFSKCINLKNLTLNEFGLLNSNTFKICHPRLSNLRLERGHRTLNFVNVVAPQLENLRIYNCWGQHLIFAPQLVSLDYKYCEPLQFSTDEDLCSLEKVDLYIYPFKSDTSKVVGLLQRFHNVKFLKLNLELVEILSSEMKLISLPPSPFANLKSLKIYPTYIPSYEEAQKRVYISNEVKSYLLDGSLSATFTMASLKEMRRKTNPKHTALHVVLCDTETCSKWWEMLMEAGQGFHEKKLEMGDLFDDSCVFGVGVIAVPVFTQVDPCQLMTKPPNMNMFTRKIDKFSAVTSTF